MAQGDGCVLPGGLAGRKTVLRFGDLLLDSSGDVGVEQAVAETVSVFHKKNPLVGGIGKEALREKFGLSPEVFAAVTDSLVREKKIEVAGDLVRLPGHGVVMKDEEAESKRRLKAHLPRRD